MPHHLRDEPSFWRMSPKALAYTTVFAEAVDHRVASFVLGTVATFSDNGVPT